MSCLTSPVLGLQAHTITLGFCTGMLGMELGSPQLCDSLPPEPIPCPLNADVNCPVSCFLRNLVSVLVIAVDTTPREMLPCVCVRFSFLPSKELNEYLTLPGHCRIPSAKAVCICLPPWPATQIIFCHLCPLPQHTHFFHLEPRLFYHPLIT